MHFQQKEELTWCSRVFGGFSLTFFFVYSSLLGFNVDIQWVVSMLFVVVVVFFLYRSVWDPVQNTKQKKRSCCMGEFANEETCNAS